MSDAQATRLSAQTQRELAVIAKGTDEVAAAAKLLLYHAIQPVIENIVQRVQTPVGALEDARQAGALGLFEAIARFDPDRKVALATFAWPYIKGEVLKAAYGTVLSKKGDGIDLVEFEEEHEPTLAQVEFDLVDVRVFVEGLSELDQQVYKWLFIEGWTHARAAAELGISRAAVTKRLASVARRGREVLLDLN